jgi:internalin A
MPLARFPAADQWAGLTQVGLEMQLRRAAVEEPESEHALFASEEDVRRWLAAALKQDAGRAGEFLDHLARRTGLLLPRGEWRYAFIHLSFLEFFAAWYLRREITSLAWLLDQQDEIPPVVRREALHRYAADPRWHIPLLFVCELLASDERRDFLERRVFPALFGGDFAAVEEGTEEGVRRGVLLARLVVDPHVGWDERAGWGAPLRLRALDACCRAAVAAQRRSQAVMWQHLPLIVRTLLAGEQDHQATTLAALVRAARQVDLRALLLDGTGMTDLGPLRDLTGLEGLSLNVTSVTELDPLRGLTALQNLYLNRTGVTDLGPLRDLTALRRLSLNGTRVTEVSPLRGLTSLQRLFLDGTGVTDLGPLKRLIALQRLSLDETGVTELDPLRGLIALEELSLNRTGVSDLAPLGGLTALQRLYLDGTKVVDLGPLRALIDLRELSLKETAISPEQIAHISQALPRCSISA